MNLPRRTVRPALLVAVVLLATACTGIPRPSEFRATSAAWPAGTHAGTGDGRARFRQIFCDLVSAAGDVRGARNGCGALLWKLDDEPPPSADATAPPLPGDLRVFVVSGAFADCRREGTVPYEAEISRLEATGTDVRATMVSGRSGAGHNAAELATAIREAGVGEHDRIVLVGYSKGAVDSLQFLVDYPDLAAHVAAVVSVAGPIYGSPLAATAEGVYRLFSDSFASVCDPGDGGVIESLLPDVRRQWLEAHPLPAHVRYYSLASFPTRKHLARGLEPSWQMLAPTDTRNDGQVLVGDAVIPGSTLLGYVNADHWDVAIAVERQMPFFSGRPDPRQFPRAALFDALLRYVGETLGPAPASPAIP
ncbi:MAG: hypothetical protein U1F08_03625 [Steroidobacteraceae bacterium]